MAADWHGRQPGAWQTQKRRLQTAAASKSKIPPVVGTHRQLGNWLTGAVVGLTLLGIAYPIGKNILVNQLVSKEPFQVLFIVLMFAATIASLVLLYRALAASVAGSFCYFIGFSAAKKVPDIIATDCFCATTALAPVVEVAEGLTGSESRFADITAAYPEIEKTEAKQEVTPNSTNWFSFINSNS